MRILDFLVKEFRQIRRDRRLMPLLSVAPVLQLVLFGYVVSTDIKHLEVLVCDLDHTPESRELVRGLFSSEYFDYVGSVQDVNAVQAFLDSGRASIVLVIPRGFERDLKAGNTAQVQALLDGSDANAGTVAVGYLGKAFESRAMRLLQERISRIGLSDLSQAGVDARIRIWYNPTLESRNYMVPGVMCLIVANLTTLLTALALVKEREMGTIEQLIVTPIRSWELMVGKMLPYLVIAYVNIAFILIVGTLLFGVPVRGSATLLLTLAAPFAIAHLSIGLLVSTVSQSQQQATMATIFFLLPNILLSGFIFPIENMPSWLQPITYLLPTRYFLVIVRGIFLKGSGIEVLWDQVIPLTLLAVGILIFATLRFQKRLD